MKLKLKGRRFDTIEEIEDESQRVLDTDRKGLPGSVPKWRRRWHWGLYAGGNYFEGDGGLMLSFMIFTASVRNSFDRTSYICGPPRSSQ
jgi:hypothetical protein